MRPNELTEAALRESQLMAEVIALKHDSSRMQAALEEIRDRGALMQNGGAWAAGIAVLCLATLAKR